MRVGDDVVLRRCSSSAARPDCRGSRRSRAGRAPGARRQRAEHGWQDGCAEDARARRAAAPGRPAAAGPDGGAPGLRPGARRHRRRAVDRDEPLDLLRPRSQHRLDPRGGDRADARRARRARVGHGSGRGLGARPGRGDPACASGAADRRDDALRRAEGVGERDRRGPQCRDSPRPRFGRAVVPHRARPSRGVAGATDRRAARSRRCRRRRRAVARRARSGCASTSSSPRPRAPNARLRPPSTRQPPSGRPRQRRPTRAEAAEALLAVEIDAVRASAERERQLALERAERDLAEARRELEGAARGDPARPAAREGARPRLAVGGATGSRGRARARPASRRRARPVRRGPSGRCARSSRCRCSRPSRSATRSRHPTSGSGGRSPRSRGRRPRCSGAAGCA